MNSIWGRVSKIQELKLKKNHFFIHRTKLLIKLTLSSFSTMVFMKDKYGLLTYPIGHVLFKMSLPNLLGILTILSASLIDTFFISKLGSHALTAISFTFSITLVISSIAIGIGTGVATNLGRLIGAGLAEKAKYFLHDTLVITTILMLSLGIMGACSIDILFPMLGASQNSIPVIHQYMWTWYLGSPCLVLMMVNNQALRATGDTRSPAIIMGVTAGINIILDPLFIFGLGPFPRLEVQGAAIATVISWLTALTLSGYLLSTKKQLLIFAGINIQRMKQNWRKLAKIAQPAAVMNLINPIFNAIIIALISHIDYQGVAAFGAGTKIESILLIVTIAISSSLVPFIAQNLGADQTKRAKDALLSAIKFIVIFQTVLYIPIAISAKYIAMLFSSDPNIIHWITIYLRVLPLAYGPLSIVILVATSLNAYHRPIASLMLNICRLFIIMLPMALFGAKIAGIEGLLLAIPTANILMGIVCYIIANHISESHHFQSRDIDLTNKKIS